MNTAEQAVRPMAHEKPRPVGPWATIAIIATVASVIAFLLWTVASSNDRFFTAPVVHETDYFNVLARGFRQGTLSLNVEGPPQMRQLADPYDPKQRGELGMHDASYYKGRYYLYWGPAPVVTLLLPFHMLTGRDLQIAWATAAYSITGYLVLAIVVLAVWRRYFPEASASIVCVALAVLGFCTMVPSNLRRAHIWEMPIAAGFCFASLAIAATYAALHRPRRTQWLTAAGILLGLAVASRAVYVAGLPLVAAPLFWWWITERRERHSQPWPSRRWWYAAVGSSTALGLIALALLLYNYLRFENPFEFGMRYQLTGAYEIKVRHFSLGYWWHNFRLYVVNPARWSSTFPYVMPGEPPHPGPAGYLYSEWVTAVFPNMPIYLFAFAVPLAIRRLWRHSAAAWLLGVGGFAVSVSALLFGFVSSADRYMVDFLPSWALLASVGALELDVRLRAHRRAKTVGRVLWMAAAAVSIIVGAIASIETQGVLSHAAPNTYRRVAQLFTAPLEWLKTYNDDPTLLLLPRGTMARRWSVELTPQIDLPAWKTRCFPLIVAGRHEMADTLVLLVTGDHSVRLGYDHWGDSRILSPEIVVEDRRQHRWQITYSALDETDRDRTYRWLTAKLDGSEVWKIRVACYGTLLDRVRIGENDIGATTCEKSFPTLIPAHVVPPR